MPHRQEFLFERDAAKAAEHYIVNIFIAQNQFNLFNYIF